MSDKNVGPAFPMVIEEEGCITQFHKGLTKREWYVGQALAGIMANEGLCNRLNSKDMGRMAVLVADAAMEALK
jgi:hypothetical protein